jgi:hypothetical protein
MPLSETMIEGGSTLIDGGATLIDGVEGAERL